MDYTTMALQSVETPPAGTSKRKQSITPALTRNLPQAPASASARALALTPALAQSSVVASKTSRSATNNSTTPTTSTSAQDVDMSDEELLGGGVPQPAESDRDLLALRKGFKRSASNLARSRSHLGFIQECVSRKLTPKGLKIGTQCHALLADMTDVKLRFDQTKNTAETDFADHLVRHYMELVKTFEKEVAQIETEMTVLLQAIKDGPTIDHHKEIMDKMTANLRKHEVLLEESKKKKLSALSAPGPSRTRKRQPPPYQNNKRNGNKQGNRRNTPNAKDTITDHTPNTNSNELVSLLQGLKSLLTNFSSAAPPLLQQPPVLIGNNTSHAIAPQPPSLLGHGVGLAGQPPPLSVPDRQHFPAWDRQLVPQPYRNP